MSALKTKFGPGWLAATLLGVANGVAPLGSDGKIASSYFPSSLTGGLNFKGLLDLSGGAFPSSPTNGDFYIVSVAGTISGQAYHVGDYVFYSSAQTAWEHIESPTSTDQIGEGSTNLFFTTARAQTAAVVNTLTGSQTAQAPSVSAVNAALGLKAASFTRNRERFTLQSTDITNGYIILSQLAKANTLEAGIQGLGLVEESVDGTTGDYTLTTDGSSGHTKLTWLNDLASGGATPLAAGDIIYVKYSY